MDLTLKTIKAYDEYAKEYKERYIKVGYAKMLQPSLDKFIEMVGKGKNVLEIGSGAGFDARYLTEKGFHVTGIDLSKGMLKVAKKTAPKAKLLYMDVRKMDFDNEIFDGVWSSATLLHLPKKEISKILNKICEMLKPGGVFYVDFKKGEGERFEVNEGSNNLNGAKRFFAYYSENEVKEMLKATGFNVVEYFSRDNGNNIWMHFFNRKVN